MIGSHAYVLFYKRRDISDDYDFKLILKENLDKLEVILK
jgi:hypothetical protein